MVRVNEESAADSPSEKMILVTITFCHGQSRPPSTNTRRMAARQTEVAGARLELQYESQTDPVAIRPLKVSIDSGRLYSL
jgi:hypothetical protein